MALSEDHRQRSISLGYGRHDDFVDRCDVHAAWVAVGNVRRVDAGARSTPAPDPETEAAAVALDLVTSRGAATHALEISGHEVDARPLIVADRLPALDVAGAVEVHFV